MFFKLRTASLGTLLCTALPGVCFGQKADVGKPNTSAVAPVSTAAHGAPVAADELFVDHGAAGLWQSLQKLHTRASLLMVTAHPDDEDGAMLTYESRGQGAHVTLLTLNRGEGGANVMSANCSMRSAWYERRNCWPRTATTASTNTGLASSTTASRRPKKKPWTSGDTSVFWRTPYASCA